jgi:hypothetical protein
MQCFLGCSSLLLYGQKLGMKSFVLEFFITACFVNLAVSLPQYQFASHKCPLSETRFSTHAKAQATFMLSFVE